GEIQKSIERGEQERGVGRGWDVGLEDVSVTPLLKLKLEWKQSGRETSTGTSASCIIKGNEYPRKGQNQSQKRQNQARERKEREAKPKSKPSQSQKVNPSQSKYNFKD
ncbi:hypothetical protein Tco_0273420, partial [Tanacetum coccineum]